MFEGSFSPRRSGSAACALFPLFVAHTDLAQILSFPCYVSVLVSRDPGLASLLSHGGVL